MKGKQPLGTSEIMPWRGGAQASGKGPRNFCAQSPIEWGWVPVLVKTENILNTLPKGDGSLGYSTPHRGMFSRERCTAAFTGLERRPQQIFEKKK